MLDQGEWNLLLKQVHFVHTNAVTSRSSRRKNLEGVEVGYICLVPEVLCVSSHLIRIVSFVIDNYPYFTDMETG